MTRINRRNENCDGDHIDDADEGNNEVQDLGKRSVKRRLSESQPVCTIDSHLEQSQRAKIA